MKQTNKNDKRPDASLAFYNAVKGAAKAKVPGAEVIYNDLRKRFIGTKKVTSEE